MIMALPERQYVSQYATDVIGLTINVNGSPTDPDDQTVQVRMVNEATSLTVLDRPATRVAVGMYEVQLSTEETSEPGNYTIYWEYTLSGQADSYETLIVVGERAPAYDNLVPGMKDVVDSVWMRFADGFDSPFGGPNVQTYFQAHFGRGRLAQILRIAVGRLNTAAQPHQSFSIEDGGNKFPLQQWGALLEQLTYVETIKHLRRAYVEQPSLMGGEVSRLDRRDYLDRWGMILSDEEELVKQQMDVFKISSMGLGRPKVLVSGGVFGRYGPTRFAGSAAARGHWWTRFY